MLSSAPPMDNKCCIFFSFLVVIPFFWFGAIQSNDNPRPTHKLKNGLLCERKLPSETMQKTWGWTRWRKSWIKIEVWCEKCADCRKVFSTVHFKMFPQRLKQGYCWLQKDKKSETCASSIHSSIHGPCSFCLSRQLVLQVLSQETKPAGVYKIQHLRGEMCQCQK